jgi:hypothetical protein
MENKVDFSENFTIFSDGKLYNRKTKKFRKWFKSTTGYYTALITEKGEKRLIKQHRLLAKYFIPNPENKREVNHINGIKTDNRLINLEWVTSSENKKHAYNTGLNKPFNKKVINTLTNIVYKSVTDAAIDNNISRNYLSIMLTGRQRNKTNLQFYNN